MNNPLAFPRPASQAHAYAEPVHEEDGMTLRDYFAAAALTGLLANANNSVCGWTAASASAASAYTAADLMLAQREKTA